MYIPKRQHPAAMLFAIMAMMMAVFSLSACDTLQLQKPQTTEDGLRYTQGQISGAYRTIGDLKATGQITAAQGHKLFDVAEVAEGYANAGDLAVSQGDPTTAAQKLALAKTALLTLQTQLHAAQRAKSQPSKKE